MTCIVGLVYNGSVYMGGDSSGVAGWDRTIMSAPKVFRVGDFLIGYTSSFRMGQLLQYQLAVKDQDGEDDRTYMVAMVVEAIRDLLKNYGYSTVDNNVETGGVSLIGYRGHLYQIENDFSVLERADKFDAVGCGANFALGALAVNKDKTPHDRVEEALQVSSYFSIGVSAPFHIEVLP